MAWILALGLVSAAASQSVAASVDDSRATVQETSSAFKAAAALSEPEVAGDVSDAGDAALTFIDRHAAQWGVTSESVRLSKTIPGVAGLTTLRFVQTISGLDVLGTIVALTLDEQLRLVSFDIKTLQMEQPLPLVATLTQQQAQLALQTAFASAQGVLPSSVSVSKLRPVVADSTLVDDIPVGLHLAWSSWTAVSGRPDSVAVSVLDDDTSALLYTSPIARHITYTPNVCDLQSAVTSDYSGQNTALGSSGLVRSYGNYMYINAVGDLYPLCGTTYAGRNTASTDIAVSNIDATWKYFKDVLNVDINDEQWLGNISSSINGDRNPRISAFTNVCLLDSKANCPSYGNAFWVPWSAPTSICRTGACSGIFLGAGFDLALDVIAHELTHGLTFSIAFQEGFSSTSEAAALSEGLSDVFGQAAERLSPNSKPDPSWQVGEDVVGADAGPFRVMRTGSSLSGGGNSTAVPAITKDWKAGDGHVNNGPLNRFAWLIANGATVGTTTVRPIGTVPADGICDSLSECTGTTRMSVLLYQAMSSLTSSSSYFDFGQAVMKTCKTLSNNQVAGFNATACTNVGRALRLTGISKLSLTNITTRTSVKKYTNMSIVASAKSYSGAIVAKQPLKLEQLVNNKWVVIRQADALCQRYCTTAQGRVTFTVKWSKSARYRISANSNFSAMLAQTPSYLIRVY
jgi:Zn-dependent metalloprotease